MNQSPPPYKPTILEKIGDLIAVWMISLQGERASRELDNNGGSGPLSFSQWVCLVAVLYCMWQWVATGFFSWEGFQWALWSAPFTIWFHIVWFTNG